MSLYDKYVFDWRDIMRFESDISQKCRLNGSTMAALISHSSAYPSLNKFKQPFVCSIFTNVNGEFVKGYFDTIEDAKQYADTYLEKAGLKVFPKHLEILL
jgi:hypothetical protein